MAIEPIRRVSPSLFARLRRCGLAEALSRRNAVDGARPSRPPARLGTAAHAVLETVVRSAMAGESHEPFAAWIQAQWETECRKQEHSAQMFEEERLLGPVERWPSYFDVEARLTIEAQRLASQAVEWSRDATFIERWMENDTLGLEGKPDLVITEPPARLVDFKTGRPTQSDVERGSTYASQISIYATLLRAEGVEIQEALIQPLGRDPLPIEVSEQTQAAVIDEARSLASRFNAAVDANRDVDLGTPSDTACQWCPHAARCPALWSSLHVLEAMQAVDGQVLATRQTARGRALRLKVDHGTVDGEVTVTQLPPAGPVQRADVGDRIRLVGLSTTEAGTSMLVGRPGGWVRSQIFSAAV